MSGAAKGVTVTEPRARARAGIAGVSWMLLGPLAVGAAGLSSAWAGAVVMAGFALAAWAYLRGRRRARVRVSADEVLIERGTGIERIAASTITNAMTMDASAGGRLVLHLEDGASVVLDFDTEEEAKLALSELQLDRRRTVVRVPLYSTAQLVMHNVGGGFFGFGAAIIPALILLGVFKTLGPLFAVAALIPFMLGGAWVMRKLLPQLTIGADGVAFGTSTDTTKNFVRHEDLEGFQAIRRDQRKSPGAWAIDMVPRQGKAKQITFFPAGDYALAAALVERIETAIAEKRGQGGDTVASLEEIERRGESHTEWLERLRAFADAKSDYRRARIEDQQLESTLADGEAPLDRRVAAGMMLRIRKPEEGRAHTREAAEGAADPAARDALLALAEAEVDEAAFEEAAQKLMKS